MTSDSKFSTFIRATASLVLCVVVLTATDVQAGSDIRDHRTGGASIDTGRPPANPRSGPSPTWEHPHAPPRVPGNGGGGVTGGVTHDHRTGSAGIDTGRAPANAPPSGSTTTRDHRLPHQVSGNGDAGVTVTDTPRGPTCLGDLC
jgi:hypothetical protein